jgi:hypothetical protein
MSFKSAHFGEYQAFGRMSAPDVVGSTVALQGLRQPRFTRKWLWRSLRWNLHVGPPTPTNSHPQRASLPRNPHQPLSPPLRSIQLSLSHFHIIRGQPCPST